VFVFGGPGDDIIDCGVGEADPLIAGSYLAGGDGNDIIHGGIGSNLFDEYNAQVKQADTLVGAPPSPSGTSAVTFSRRNNGHGVVIHLDGGPSGDPTLQESITLSGIQVAFGTPWADTIFTSTGGGDVFGGAGNDTIVGRSTGGSEVLVANAGKDLVRGTAFSSILTSGDGQVDNYFLPTGRRPVGTFVSVDPFDRRLAKDPYPGF